MQSSLPYWDLDDLYHSRADEQITSDCLWLQEEAAAFVQDYQGHLASHLGEAVERYQILQERMDRLMSYAYLMYATNLEDGEVLRFFQDIQEKITQLSAPLVFFTLEINQIEESLLRAAYEHNELKRYQPWIDNLRLFRPYLLSPELEQFIYEKSVTSRSAWVRLYDETLAQLRCPLAAKEATLSEVLNQMSEPDATRRFEAAQALSQGLQQKLPLLTLITNTLAKDKEVEDTWRKYPNPTTARNLDNQIEDEVVDALVTSVRAAYPRLSHRYYQWKANFLGQEKIEYWDRNAPLAGSPNLDMPWEDAQTLVLEAYNSFSPAMAEIAELFFKNAWIDAVPRAGKESGAFAHPTVPSVHPYILLNYHGKARDVMTLAHELGHVIHQYLAAPQGHLLAQTPLTIAETASVFGEMLTFQALLQQTKDPQAKRALLAGKIEDMLNTVVRQIAFFDFERQLHQKRRQGEVSSEAIAELWLETQREALGPAVHLDPLIKPYWSYISHFIHAPFYVYAYAFGDCLVNSLYAVYQTGFPNFSELYLELLRAGGSKHHQDLLAPFNLNAKEPTFWSQGLQFISQFIDGLEAQF